MNNIDNPIDLFVGWGFCQNLANVIWSVDDINNTYQDTFVDYKQQIQNDISFQCVIMARYSWGVLFIDVCDDSSWEIKNIKEPHIYLKLQYNSNFNYKNNVKPFTYCVHNPIDLDNNITKYRELYKNTLKTSLVYGRWIGISLARYKIAEKMRTLGVYNGGEYCQTPKGTGYDDHEDMGLLDPISPRTKIGWDQYFKYMCSSESSLDACGFGDFTHRMIESFGIGIPLIRPKLKNNTCITLEADTHYLDCGEYGEKLEECLIKIKDINIRNELICNGMYWYDNNASPNAIKRMINTIIAFQNRSKMEHIYKQDNFGEDWFSYANLYSDMVNKYPSGSHFVEIGSWKGKSSSYMAVEILNSNKNIKFDCIDTWHGSAEHGGVYLNNNTLYDIFTENMKSLKEYHNPIQMTSVDASKMYKDASLDFVFIDASHEYEHVKEDISCWLPKLKSGGTIAGHDYPGWDGVKKAVDEKFSQVIQRDECWVIDII